MHWLLINATYQFWSWHSSKHNRRSREIIRALLQEWKDRIQGDLVILMLSANHYPILYINFHTFFKLSCIYIYIYLEFVIYPSFFTMNIIWWEILFLQITIFYPFLKRIFTKRIKTFKFLFIFLLYMINIKNTWNMM